MKIRSNTINILWHIDDVLEQRPDLTREQARKVLDLLKRNHDACIGINWDVIDTVCQELYPI